MRTSPVHYIAPSAISIVPNCNGSANDLAVTISRGVKIKVYCPRAGIDKVKATGEYQEWTLAGRNRRLADSTKPYTIYARLPKSDKTKGYVVFSPMTPYPGDVWIDKHLYLDPNTPDGLADLEGVFVQDGNWWVKLGDVSLPDANNQRTVTLDTGILGTDQFNDEWALRPDELPLRIEVGATINDEDVGQTPYVYWGQSLVLTAMLTEGWTGTDIQRFDHWKITRNSGDDAADNRWLIMDSREAAFTTSGEITLRHLRNNDDFNGAVATTFTIMAMERNPEYEDGSELDPYLVLKSATIAILAETIERYELSLSDYIVSYNPQTGNHTPQNGVSVSIRATDQRGDVFGLTNKEMREAGLSVKYAPTDAATEETLTFSGADNAPAAATLPIAAFAAQKSVNVRLLRTVAIAAGDSDSGDSDSGNPEDQTIVTELARTTIAFVRDGEDSKEREWIFLRSTESITFGTPQHPYPSAISGGQVNPTDAATGTDTDKNQDGWVPQGWYDEQQGVDANNPYEYGAYRDYIHESDEDNDNGGRWGPFSEPKIWSHYGKDGKSISKKSETATYQVSDSGTTTPSGSWQATKQAAVNAWNTAHDISGSEWAKGTYMWTRTVIIWTDGTTDTATTLYQAERNPDDGQPGMSVVIDSQNVQYSKQAAGNLDPSTLTYGAYPASLGKGDWLYSRTTIVYKTSGGASAGTTVTYSVSYIGTDGDNGAGISGITEHYRASANATGETAPTTDTNEWGTNPMPSDWDDTKRYLWNYEKIAKVDKNGNTTYERTTASVVAIFTKGIDSITNYYLTNNIASGITKQNYQNYQWSTSITPTTEGAPYLWNYEVVAYTDGSTPTMTAPHVIGHYGKDGTKTQRRYRSTNSSTYTDAAPTTDDTPTGWSEVGVPTPISSTARYRWMIERTSDDGGTTWGNWSPPVIDAYLAQDGTSVAIKGQADGVVEWNSMPPATASSGDRWLLNNSSSSDYAIFSEDIQNPGFGIWTYRSADIGDCYLVGGYLWVKVRDNATASQPRWENMGRLQGLDGENAIVVDLDNESEVMLYDGSGNRVSQVATSQATLLNGNTPVTNGVTWRIPNATGVTLKNNGNATAGTYSGDTDCWISTDGLVTVRGLAAADAEISVMAGYNQNYYYSKFTLHKQIGGDKYDLVVSPNAIPYNSTSQTPYQTSVVVSLYKTSIDGTRALSAPPSGYVTAVFYGEDATPNVTSQTSSFTFAVLPAATDANNVRIVVCRLSNDQIVDGSILDSETIPIARTANGGSPTIYSLLPTHETLNFTRNTDGTFVQPSFTVMCGIEKQVGTERTVMTSGQEPPSSEHLNMLYRLVKTDGTHVNVNGSTVSSNGSDNRHDWAWMKSQSDNAREEGGAWTSDWSVTVLAAAGYVALEFAVISSLPYHDRLNVTEDLILRKVRIPILYDGGPGGIGETGHTGRFFYYDGPYDSSKTYRIEASQSPYIKYTDPNDQSLSGFFMLDYGGTEPPTIPYEVTGVAPSFSPGDNNPWTQMSSQHQYYIARAFFADNAYLGAFIINVDWMLSQYGTLTDTNGYKTTINASNADTAFNGKLPYAWFDASDPTTSTTPQSGYKFTPNFAVDGLTGKTYQNDAYIRGEVHATSGEFGGVLKKSKTIITSANSSQYIYYDTAFQEDMLDIVKAGTNIVFSDLSESILIMMPGLYGYGSSNYSKNSKDFVRSLIGNVLLLYNYSSKDILITGNTSSQENYGATSFALQPNQACVMECKVRRYVPTSHDDQTFEGYEDVYWLRRVLVIN